MARVRTVDPRQLFVEVWEERDRLHIALYATKGKHAAIGAGILVAEWWDDDARSMFEDGFFDARNLKESVIEYAASVGLVKFKKENRRNPGGALEGKFAAGDEVTLRPDRADAYGEPRGKVYVVARTYPDKRYKKTWVVLAGQPQGNDTVTANELRPVTRRRANTHIPPKAEKQLKGLLKRYGADPVLGEAGEILSKSNGPRFVYTIQSRDVGKKTLPIAGKRVRVEDFLGVIQAIDVGKRVYDTGDGVYQVENDDQMKRRLGNGRLTRRREKNPGKIRVVRKKSGASVIFNADYIQAFKNSYPASGIPELDWLKFDFDGNGDLVAIETPPRQPSPETFDGAGLSALADDARQVAYPRRGL